MCLVAVACILASRDTAAQHDTDTIVPETFRKAEIIIGPLSTRSVAVFIVAIHTEGDIDRLQGTSGNIADLTVQETVQGSPHIQVLFPTAAVCQVHSGDDHADSQLRPFILTHAVQTRLHRLIFGSRQNELQAQILQLLLQGDTHIEVHHT